MQAEPATQQAEQPFRFLDLHPEIRNAIYSLVLEDSAPIKISVKRCYKIGGYPAKFLNTALLTTNRQIHAEASSILYGANTFQMETYGLPIFRKLINKNALLVTSLVLEFRGYAVALEDAMDAMAKSKRLKSLKIRLHRSKAFAIAEDFAWALLPWALAFPKDQEGGPCSGLSFVNAPDQMPLKYTWYFKSANAADYEIAVKEELEKLLEENRATRSRERIVCEYIKT